MSTAKKARRKRLPEFKSQDDFVRFVDTHDLSEYWDEFEELKDPVELDPKLAREIDRRSRRKHLISLRLELWQVRLARAIAAREGIPYHTVIRNWITAGIRSKKRISP